jgi:hypothetical protein
MKKQNKKSKTKVHRIMYRTPYPARVLALVLGGVMFLEGMLFGVTTTADLSEGMQILDMSAAISTTKADLAWLAEPLVVTVNGVNNFYVLASQELIVLLEDNFFNNALSVAYDIDSFYKVAAKEMASALDISGVLSANAYGY